MTLKIDRGAFLLLTSAIASASCTVIDNRGQTDTGTPPTDTGTTDTLVADTGTDALPDTTDATDASEVPTCDDTVGTPGDCTMIAPSDEATCGADLFARDHCAEIKDAFKPKVAEAAVACMLKLTAIEVCDAGKTYKCAHDAIVAACPDATAGTACDAIVAGCAGASFVPTKDDCMKELAGMTTVGRDKMVLCMKTSCVASGLYGCEEGL